MEEKKEIRCEDCGMIISEKIRDYSKSKYGKILCFNCQKNAVEKETNIVTKKENESEKSNEDKYTILIKGKRFILFDGLLAIAHEKGLKMIRTELVTENVDDAVNIIFKAVVEVDNKVFTAYGDANDNNVGNMILPHKIRMAETRAVARALRFACNIGMCSVEELGD
ncbi:MAG: hypothetical protein EOL97_14685 [Spirochaetia bacterium]|nr:hypothetical protein [Spirochaetia bacterium]